MGFTVKINKKEQDEAEIDSKKEKGKMRFKRLQKKLKRSMT